MAGLLSRFTTFLPNTTILSNDHNQEFNRIVNLLNGTTTNLKTVLKTSDAGDPPLELDQLGAGPILEAYQGGIIKASINNTGQIETVHQFKSTVATGTKPLDVASTTKVDNLNADLLDGLSSAAFAQLAANVSAFSVTWFYAALPGAVESTESVGRFIVPAGTAITITNITAVWVGGSSSGGTNTFTIKRQNITGDAQSDVGTISLAGTAEDVNNNNITDVPLTTFDQIFPLFTTRNTASETLVSITITGTQKLT